MKKDNNYYIIRVSSGFGTDGDKTFKRYPNANQIAHTLSNKLLEGRAVKLTAIGADAVFNMHKIVDMAQKNLERLFTYADKSNEIILEMGSERVSFENTDEDRKARKGTSNYVIIQLGDEIKKDSEEE